VLNLNKINFSYDNLQVLHEVSLRVEEGEIVCLVGSNGAGKSTLLNVISGLLRPVEGSILFYGTPLQNLPTHKIVSKGLILVPEGREIFPGLTVEENLKMGAYAWYNKKEKENFNVDIKNVYDLFPILYERKKQRAWSLSGGELQMLAIARGLMARAKLLLLDEPSLGLAPILVDQLFDVIKDINKSGTTVFIAEQNAYKAFEISNRAYVIEMGKIILEGSTEECIKNEKVRKAYLGG